MENQLKVGQSCDVCEVLNSAGYDNDVLPLGYWSAVADTYTGSGLSKIYPAPLFISTGIPGGINIEVGNTRRVGKLTITKVK